MNKLQNTKNEISTNDKFQHAQNELVNSFFRRDGMGEIVESMHFMVESFLFSDDLERVTPEMRVHIVNQLRAATLMTKLGETVVK